jgi:GTP-binding protein
MLRKEFIVTQGKYIASAVKKEQYPEEELPEFVFIGRSNVGKSSLINSLTRIKNLAHVSSQPGKTQTINFFRLELKDSGETETRLPLYLVDLPGYGYARAGKQQRKIWSSFIREYLLTSPNLKFVCQLIDIRHPPMESDITMFQWLVSNNIPVLVVATKADKIGKHKINVQISIIKARLGIPELSVIPYSSIKGEGRSDLLDVIGSYLIK